VSRPLQKDFSPHPKSLRHEEGEASSAKSASDELARWERSELNRLGDGRPIVVTSLPDEQAFEASAGLLFGGNFQAVAAVNGVFRGPVSRMNGRVW